MKTVQRIIKCAFYACRRNTLYRLMVGRLMHKLPLLRVGIEAQSPQSWLMKKQTDLALGTLRRKKRARFKCGKVLAFCVTVELCTYVYMYTCRVLTTI